MEIKTKFSVLVLCLVVFFTASVNVNGQSDAELGKAVTTAMQLFNQERYAEAVPHFEVVAKAMPTDGKVRFLYGWCLLAKSKQVTDANEAKQLSAKALEQFREAKKLGLNEDTNDALIAILSGERPASGPGASSGPIYSKNPQAEKAMIEAEALFAQSKYNDAAKLFEKVLTLDPTLYQAAVSGGDCFVQSGDWAIAEKWYQRAIAIDPNRETAYRYSATPLMKQKKYDQARDRYIEAFIVEPYNSMSARGINQWASITGKDLAHPTVDVPDLTFDSKGKAVANTAINPKDAGQSPWLAYLAVREAWKNEKFAKTFPNEKQYRHSLAEETESLRAAVKTAQAGKSLNKQFELLGKLDKDGLLEAYVLLGRPDEGIAEDHPDYLKNNRPKLRQYVADYVIQK